MKDIKGYEGLYAITSCGKVWSYKRKIFLKPHKEKGGYLRVCLCKNGSKKPYLVHRLVLETYCPVEDMDKLEVNHIDENKEHNYLNNLEWMSHKENTNYGTGNKRSATARCKKVRCIETKVVYNSIKEASIQTEIGYSGISACCRGIRKTAGGYHWEFVCEK